MVFGKEHNGSKHAEGAGCGESFLDIPWVVLKVRLETGSPQLATF